MHRSAGCDSNHTGKKDRETIPSSRRRYFVSTFVIQFRPLLFVGEVAVPKSPAFNQAKPAQHSQRLVLELLYSRGREGETKC